MVGLIVAAVLGCVAGVLFGSRITAEIRVGFALVAQTVHERAAVSRPLLRPRCNALRSEAAVPGWMWRPGAIGILRRVPGRRQGS